MINAVRFIAVNSDVPHVLFTFIVPVMSIRNKGMFVLGSSGTSTSDYFFINGKL